MQSKGSEVWSVAALSTFCFQSVSSFNSEKNMELAIQMAARDEVMQSHMTDLIRGLKPYSEVRTALMRRVLTRHPRDGLKMLV